MSSRLYVLPLNYAKVAIKHSSPCTGSVVTGCIRYSSLPQSNKLKPIASNAPPVHCQKIGPKSAYRMLSTSTCVQERSYEDVNHHVMKTLHAIAPEISDENSRSSISRKSRFDCTDVDKEISNTIFFIAHDDYYEAVGAVVDLFHYYAQNNRPIMQDKVNCADNFERMVNVIPHLIPHMNMSELKSMSESLLALRGQTLNLINRLIMIMCTECASRVIDKRCSFIEGITYFEIALKFYSSGMGKRSDYDIFIDFFAHKIDDAPENALLTLVHYASFKSRCTSQKNLLSRVLKRLENNFQSMSYTDFGIIANSILKGGVELTPDMKILIPLSNKLLERLTSSEPLTKFDDINFEMMLKLLRLSRFNSPEFNVKFQDILTNNNLSKITGEMIPNILAYFAANYYNEDLFNKLQDRFIYVLHYENPMLSMTDYARINWAFSHCSHNCSKEYITLMHDDLQHFLRSGKAYKHYSKFADILLSLAMLGHSNETLLDHVFNQPIGEIQKKSTSRKKLLLRLQGLYEHISIEFPYLAEKPGIANLRRGYLASFSDQQLDVLNSSENRKALRHLCGKLEDLCDGKGIAIFSLTKPIKTVNISSVCCVDSSFLKEADCSNSSGKQYELMRTVAEHLPLSIEVVDSSCTLPESSDVGRRPTGLLSYKQRLLRKSGWTVLMLEDHEIQSCDDVIDLIIMKLNTSYQSKNVV